MNTKKVRRCAFCGRRLSISNKDTIYRYHSTGIDGERRNLVLEIMDISEDPF